MAARIADETGKRQLVEADEAHANEAAGGLSVRSGIVAAGWPLACGGTAIFVVIV